MTVHYHVLLVHGCHIQSLELGQLVVDELVGHVVIGSANILQLSVEGQSIYHVLLVHGRHFQSLGLGHLVDELVNHVVIGL